MSHRFLSLSLRTLLLILATLLALPAVAVIVDAGLRERKDAIAGSTYQGRRLADNIATEQYNLTGDAEQLVTVLAQFPDLKRHRAAAISPILADIHKKSAHYGNIVVTDRNGTVWASALPMNESFSLADKRSFIDARATRRFSPGEYVIGKISAKPTFGFGYPLIDAKGEFDGVIAVNINFSRFHNMIIKSGLPKGSSFTIDDRNGVVVNQSGSDEQTMVGRNDPLYTAISEGPGEGSFIATDRGKKELVSYRALRLKEGDHPYCYVRVNIPLNETLALAWKQQLKYMALLSVFLLGAFLLAAIIGKFSFLDRILKLQEVSRRIANGDFNINVCQSVRGGELGDLGQAFEEMARQINAREAALKEIAAEHREVIGQLQTALGQIDTLNSMLPICSFCKKILDGDGHWKQLEIYLSNRSQAVFAHCICPECSKKVVTEVGGEGD